MKKSVNFLFIFSLLTLMLVFSGNVFGQQDQNQDDSQDLSLAEDSIEQSALDSSSGYVSASANSLEVIWDKANTEFVNGNFKGAIVEYNNIVATGNTSARLHYNLANSYYKVGQMGSAILNYRRAQILDPSDKDIRYNLEIAQTQVKDKIEEVPELFISRFVAGIRSYLSSNEWAKIAFGLFVLAIIMFLVYLISSRTAIRKFGFILSMICIALFVCTLSFSFAQRKVIILEKEAIVMSGAVAVKSSPDRGSKDIFILHEGTSIVVLNTLGEWSEIMIADGNKGWMPNTAFEKVSLAK